MAQEASTPRTPRKSQSLRKPRTVRKKTTTPKAPGSQNQTAIDLAQHIRSKGAEDIVLLHVASISDYTDYLLVATGSSTTTVRALAQYVADWAPGHGHKVLGIEGLEQPDWVLLDLGSIVVHLFVPDARHYYALETLWLDAPRIPVPLPARG